MSKIGLSLSMIGGLLFFILTYIYARHFYLLWLYGEKGLLAYLFYLFINAGAIVGAILGFMDKKIGYYLSLFTGISFPLVGFYLSGPYFFEGFIDAFYIDIPWLILFIGGITGIIECESELRKNKYALE